MINKVIYKIQGIRHKGFTLIETLVAVMLLSIAIASPLTIASRALNSALVAKDQVTAFYLAQDAVEYIRFARDSACLAAGASPCATSTWLSTLGNCTSPTGSAACELDSLGQNPSAPTACASGVCDTMRFDSTNNSYNYNSGVPLSPQRFVRTISIQNDPSGSSPDEAVVTVKVTWSDIAGITHPGVIVRENLFRWQ